MAEPRSSTDRLALLGCRLGFWVPLVVCTYLALVPEAPDNPVFRLSDVILHAAAFTYLTFAFVLMGTARASDASLNRMAVLKALLVMFAYGLFLEAVQSFIPERSAELKDLGVDLIGIAVGLLLAALLVGPVLNIVQLISSWVTRVFTRQAL